ncbi:hypothetical protein AAF712_015885 [Marasmius tenuissimus]|uniref:Uncharacterized protein n=1 Tax=Marasmius tenuissimus TaxID=585030 RepID=A0ABR2Z856_9AGAR
MFSRPLIEFVPFCDYDASRWGADAIITDLTKVWWDIRTALDTDYEKTGGKYGRAFLWTTYKHYSLYQMSLQYTYRRWLESVAGPFAIDVQVADYPYEPQKLPIKTTAST